MDLARPFTPGRLRLYLWIASLQGVVTFACYLGVGTGVLAPTRALDIFANLCNFAPMVLLPMAVFVLVKGRIRQAAELTLVWLPFTAAAQLTFELAWLVGQLFGVWKPTGDPGWTWMWWQFALTDTRYFGKNPATFGMEFAAVAAAAIVLVAFVKLIRTDLTDRDRIRYLCLGGAGLTALTMNTVVYFASSFRNGLADIGQGDYGLVKFFGLNGPYLVFPVFVLIAIWRQVDHLAQPQASRTIDS